MAFGLPNMSYIGHPVALPCAGHAGLGLRQARPPDAPAIRAHLLGLAAEDRRRRFFRTLSDAAVERHVAGLWTDERLVIAARDGPLWSGPFHAAGPVRALAEVALWDGGAELALTVDRGLRRRGVGTWLLQVAGHLLAPRGIPRLTALTLPDNAAFLALARRAGAAIERAPDHVEVTFDVAALRRAYLCRRAAGAFRLAG
jgi:GNAT superfamily N-acetyltransferase